VKKKSPLLLVIIIPLLHVACWMGVSIYIRASKELLWGYRPLFLYLSLWLTWMVWRQRKELADLKWDHPLTWSTLSGLLLGLGFPGDVGLTFLMFVGFVPLFRMEQLVYQSSEAPQRTKVFRYSFHAFVLWNILSTYWLSNASIPAGIFAILANSALMALTVVLLHQSRKIIPRFNFLPFVTYWLLFEYFHYRWELSWPWLTLGNSLAEWPSLIQWYDHTGVLGGSLWILLINLMVFNGLTNYWKKENWRTEALQLLLLLLVPCLVSVYQFNSERPSSSSAEVVIVQPNFEPHYERSQTPPAVQMTQMMGLATPQLSQETDYLVFPEGTFGYFELGRFDNYPQIQQLRDLLLEYPNLKIIGGFSLFKDLGTKAIEGPFVREREENGQAVYYEVYNAAVQMTADTKGISIYKKSKLVPGPEFFPYSRLLGFLKPVVDQLGGSTASFGTQEKRLNFESPTASIAPVICYESVFGEYLSEYTKRGAQAIAVMTNDGWWDNTAGHRQHAATANIRAIENRRPVIRAASTGISCFIDSKGQARQRTGYDEAAAIQSEVYLSDEFSFYLKWGDMIGRLAMFISALFLLNTLVKSYLPGSEK
jgi:apolipoprotein N-acyltransferase